jgi:hypothetical protein
MPDTQNPYLALLQQQDTGPTWAQVLQNIGNLGFGLAGGFGQAAATGQPTMAGIGPGLMMGNSMNVQAANAAEQDRLKRAEIGLRAQEYDDKRAEALRKEKQLQLLASQYGPNGPAPGFNAAGPNPPLMGPNGTPTTGTPQPGPDLKTAGAPIVSYLMAQHGLSPLAAATVAGNLYQESGFNPANNTGDGGSAFGMAQWRLDRQTALRNFAAAQPGGPKPATDPQVQIDFLMSEMQGGDMGAQRAYALLKRATTPEEANAAMMHFFRPAGYTPANPTGGHGFANRVANTRALLPQQRPVDPATAPVPGVGPDPDAVPVAPPGPLPRPGLGPRATPQGPAPEGVPVAQGDGTGEVVLPRIGLPFPARPPVAAPPGSVPFPVIPTGPPQGAAVMPGGTGVDPNAPTPAFMQTGPGGPGIVQPQTAPGPNTPPMAPSAVPLDIMPPPVPVLPDRPTLTQADSIRLQSLVLSGHPEQAAAEANRLLQAQRSDILEQHKSKVEVWKQQQSDRQFQRGQAATVEAEQRRAAAENARNERDVAQRQAEAQSRADAEQKRYERDLAERQQTRQDAAKQSGDTLTFEQSKFASQEEDKLRDDFNSAPPVKAYRIVVPMLESAKDAATRPTRAADLNLVYAFAKLMDPDSVVRESETAGVVATASVADRLGAYIGQLNGQAMLNPDVRAKLMSELNSRFKSLDESYQTHVKAYTGIAERRGYDPNNIIVPIRGPKPAQDKPEDVPVYDTTGKRIQ